MAAQVISPTAGLGRLAGWLVRAQGDISPFTPPLSGRCNHFRRHHSSFELDRKARKRSRWSCACRRCRFHSRHYSFGNRSATNDQLPCPSAGDHLSGSPFHTGLAPPRAPTLIAHFFQGSPVRAITITCWWPRTPRRTFSGCTFFRRNSLPQTRRTGILLTHHQQFIILPCGHRQIRIP